MTLSLIAAGILSFALAGPGNAQGTPSSGENGTHYTQAQLKQMVREAHTPEQYRALASYYRQVQKSYRLQAAEEKQEWIRRSESITVVAAKYPRPVDSARNLYEYYRYRASEASELSGKYSQLAAPGAPTTPK